MAPLRGRQIVGDLVDIGAQQQRRSQPIAQPIKARKIDTRQPRGEGIAQIRARYPYFLREVLPKAWTHYRDIDPVPTQDQLVCRRWGEDMVFDDAQVARSGRVYSGALKRTDATSKSRQGAGKELLRIVEAETAEIRISVAHVVVNAYVELVLVDYALRVGTEIVCQPGHIWYGIEVQQFYRYRIHPRRGDHITGKLGTRPGIEGSAGLRGRVEG